MTYYYLRQEIDKNNYHEITAYRSAFSDADALTKFGNHRYNHGLNAALPLFKEIKFNWVKDTKNSIGDIMSGSIFSTKAKDLIALHRNDLIICEPINIEGDSAFFIEPAETKSLDENYDIFYSKTYRKAMVVSQRFKEAWEAAGLLGAQFEAIS